MAADFVLVLGPHAEGHDLNEPAQHATAVMTEVGVTFMRATPRGTHLLFEGWRERPEDQGPELTLEEAVAAERACGW